jgi:hypothetical protein
LASFFGGAVLIALGSGLHSLCENNLPECIAGDPYKVLFLRTKHPHANGSLRAFSENRSRRVPNVVFRKKLYSVLDHLQADLDAWLQQYNEHQPHSGKYCFRETPVQIDLQSTNTPGVINS